MAPSTPLFVRSLTIECFRGIPGSISLDLAAPLTILYAPNGTGKSSVCDAAEWLVTGQVDRLGVQSRGSEETLRCLFANRDSPEMSVRGEVWLGQTQYSLERRADEWMACLNGEDELVRRDSDILGLLASGAADPDDHHKTSIAKRQAWLRGTRFLSSESLAILVDPDPATLAIRERLFADLLGVRHLLDREQKCSKYLDELHRESRRTKDSIDTIQPYESDTDEAAFDQEATRRQVEEASRSAFKLLEGTDGSESQVPGEDLNELALQAKTLLSSRNAKHAARSEACKKVELGWSKLEDLRSSMGEHQKRITPLEERIEELREKDLGTQRTLRLQERSRGKAIAEVQQLSQMARKLPRLKKRLQDAAVECERLSGSRFESYLMSDLLASVPEASLNGSARAQVFREVSGFRDGLDRHLREKAELDEMPKRIAVLKKHLPTRSRLAALQKSVADRGKQIAKIRGTIDLSSDVIQKLQRAARDALKLLESSTQCPVCQHDWKSRSLLMEQVRQASRSMPRDWFALQKQLEDTEAVARRERYDLERERNRKEGVTRAENRQTTLQQRWDKYLRDLEEFGLDTRPSHIRSSIDARLASLRLAERLAEISSVVEEASKYCELVKWPQILIETIEDELREPLENARAEGDIRIQSLDSALKETRDQQKARDAEISDREAEIEFLRKEWQRDQEALRGYQDAWRLLASEPLKHSRQVKAAVDSLSRERTVLGNAERLLDEAFRALESLKQREKQRQASSKAKEQWERLRRLEKKIRVAEGTRDVLAQARKAHTQDQLRTLWNSLVPLFSRIQANRVMDQIEWSEQDPLQWMGVAGDVRLDPKNHFSQGQRQDLALSLFLSRARLLGGTFFLDEPLLYLDDLNRVGLFDILRVLVVEDTSDLAMVLTTASRALVRHIAQKFASVPWKTRWGEETPPLRVITLTGNPRVGVSALQSESVGLRK